MYNNDIKVAFIKQLTTSLARRSVCVTLFNACEEFESALGKDICTMTPQELQPVIDRVIGFRYQGNRPRIAILNSYFDWCIQNKMEGATDSIKYVVVSGQSKVAQQTVKSPLHLKRYLDSVFEPEADQTIDNVARCYFWLAYSGIFEEDAFEMKPNNFDLDNMIICVNGHSYPIYRESLPAIKNCINLNSFNRYNPAKGYYLAPRIMGTEVLRGVVGRINPKAFRVRMSVKTKEALESGRTDLRLSYERAWISGVYYVMRQREEAGLPLDVAGFFRRPVGRVLSKNEERNIGRQKRACLIDYEVWKLGL